MKVCICKGEAVDKYTFRDTRKGVSFGVWKSEGINLQMFEK